MLRTESAYEYYRCSERKSMEALKRHLENWFESFLEKGKLDSQQRFRSPIKGQHDAAYSKGTRAIPVSFQSFTY